MIPRPPPINGYEIRHSRVLRFTTGAAFAGNITFQNLLDTILFTETAVFCADIFAMVKVRRVKMWAIPALGSATSVICEFSGATAGSAGDRVLHEATSMGIEPAYLNVAPRPKTLASMFQLSSTAVAFSLNVPINTVIDVQLDFHSDCEGLNVASANNAVAATVGCVAFRGLDGVALAATKFIVPTGINQV